LDAWKVGSTAIMFCRGRRGSLARGSWVGFIFVLVAAPFRVRCFLPQLPRLKRRAYQDKTKLRFYLWDMG